MKIAARYSTIEDLERLVPLFDGYRQFYGQASDLSLARTFLADRFWHHESVILLAENSSGAAVGFTQLYPSFSSVRASRIYVLNDLFVVEAERRKGVARLLLQRAAEFGRTIGAAKLTLSTALTNERAQKLYESLGWKCDSTFCYYSLAL